MIKVGTNSFGYNHYRNFAGLPFDNVEFKKVFDLYKLPAHFFYKFQNKVVPKYINRFNDFGLNNVDLYHFFNTLTPVKKPWVVTFETSVPRMDPDFAKGYEWMAGKYCKKIIAYTQRAYNAQLYNLERFPDHKTEIIKKMIIMHPSQSRIVPDISDKDFEGDIVFTITGSVFFRKGGWELLQTFERLKDQGMPVKLNIISKLEVEGYKDLHATLEIVKISKQIIKTNPLINHYRGLPNSQVLEILKQSHVGILPSYGETFGYSLLEAMACGCPVVSTSVAPFPEFVKDSWGWLLNVPVKFRNGLEYTETDDPHEHRKFSEQLIEELYKTILLINEDRGLLRQKSINAIDRIHTFHNPLDRVQVLKNIYQNAISSDN